MSTLLLLGSRLALAQHQPEIALNVSEVRVRLREAILKGKLAPGSLHSQNALMSRLGVGRTPFREALRMVQAEGLIEILPSGRLQVPALSMRDLGQIQIARIALESAAVRIAVPRLDVDDFARLEGLIAQMSHYFNGENFDRLEHPHREFHLGLVEAAGPEMLAAIGDLFDRAGRYRWAFTAELPTYWDVRIGEHRAILDAAEAGDVEDVAARLAEHYTRAGLRLAEQTERSGDTGERERLERDINDSLAPGLRFAPD